MPAPIKTIGDVQTVAGIPGTPLKIGEVTLNSIETPEAVQITTNQEVATHQYIGGGRVIQTLGVQPEDIKWSGYFFNPSGTAYQKIQSIRRMNSDGAPKVWQWGAFKYSVVVTKFDLHVHGGYFSYDITCKVISDLSGTYSQPDQQSGIPNIDKKLIEVFQQMAQRTKQLAGADPTTGPWDTTATTIGVQLGTLGPVAQATSAQTAPLIGNIQSLVALATPYVNSFATMSSPLNAAQALQFSLSSNILYSANLLLANINSGQAPLSILVGGGSLSQLAAQYYGDPTLWTILATANNLFSPTLPTGVTTKIVVPAVNSTGQVH